MALAFASPLRTLNDHRALELGEDAAHRKHCPSRWRRGVHRLLKQKQIDASAVDLLQKRDKPLQATAEPVDRPGHHDIETMSRGVLV